MFQPIKIASFFIEKSLDEGRSLTNMKLLKLVYIAHGWYLGITGKPLINEAVMAWKYGPVIESLYQQFRIFGSSKIKKIPESGATECLKDSNSVINYEDFLSKIWDVYKDFSALQLSTLTHQERTPWDITIKKSGEFAIIPNDLIEEHYKTRINNSTEKAS